MWFTTTQRVAVRKTVRCVIGFESTGKMTFEPIVGTYRFDPDPYDAAFGDDRPCVCGSKDLRAGRNTHSYYRHFDSYEDMRPVGCKYCGCGEFKEATSV